MAQHTHYWSCSAFADWLRGTAKPGAETSEGWDIWRKTAQKAYPIRYWLAEEGLDLIQDFVTWPVRKLYDIKYYINNRWVSRTHSLTAHPQDIKPGQWCDVGNRFLPCLFNELVDFVEVEQAWHQIAWDTEAQKKYKPPFYAWGWFRWRTWRCPEAGLDYLDWASTLTNKEFIRPGEKEVPTHQALAAREIKELYIWWTTTYRNRPDPYEASGWTAYCNRKREEKNADGNVLDFFGEPSTKELRKWRDRSLKMLRKIEEDYEKEDTEMMIRLIKVRQSLWT